MPKVRRKPSSRLHKASLREDARPGKVNNGSPRARYFALIILLLLAVTIGAFWQVLDSDFTNFDDDTYVAKNKHIQAGLTRESIAWAFNAGYAGNWHPLTWMSHMLDFQFYRLKPSGHHLTSLLFHLANTLLLFLVLRRMTGFLWRSALVAALFAIHPLHVESVAWIAERKDVLSTFFWMLTMGAYVLYAERPGFRRYLAVMLLFALGLMAKPMLVTLPVVLLLLDYWPLRRLAVGDKKDGARRATFWKLVLEKIPLFALAIGSSIITLVAQRKGEAVSSFEFLPLGMRVSNALVSYTGYVGKTLWPRGLAVFYPHPANTLAEWKIAGAALLLVGLSLLVIRMRRQRPYLAVGWLWYLLTLVSVIGILQVGTQAMADRYTYVPLIGLFIMVVWGVPEFLDRPISASPRRPVSHSPILPVLAGIVVAVLMVCTWTQVGYWRNSTDLFTHALEVTTDNYIAHTNLGLALEDQGELDEAISHYEEALRIYPESCDAHLALAGVLADEGELDEAVEHYSEAIKIKPDYAAHYNLGIAFAIQGKTKMAIAEYRKAIAIDPNTSEAHNNLGVALATEGKLEGAIAEYSEALTIDPDMASAHNNLGAALVAQGKVEEGIREYRKAIRSDPGYVRAYYNLGDALATRGDLEGAIREYREAIRIKPDYVRAHYRLALALYRMGDYAEAWREVHTCEKYGLRPHPSFLEALSQKIPDPGR